MPSKKPRDIDQKSTKEYHTTTPADWQSLRTQQKEGSRLGRLAGPRLNERQEQTKPNKWNLKSPMLLTSSLIGNAWLY